MTGKDLNRSNNTGTGAKTLDRKDFPTPSQGGASGGDLQREIGQRDDIQQLSDDAGIAAEPQPTSVKKSDKPEGGGSGPQGSDGA